MVDNCGDDTYEEHSRRYAISWGGPVFRHNDANSWLRAGSELAIKAAQSILFDAATSRWKNHGLKSGSVYCVR